MTDIVTASRERFQNGYVYGRNPTFNGTAPALSGGLLGLGIDCSNLVSQSLLAAGYNVSQLSTSGIFDAQGNLTSQGSQYYAKIDQQTTPQAGDLVMFRVGNVGHIGIVTEYDAATGIGKFYGSQSSTGPAETGFTTIAGTPGYFISADQLQAVTPIFSDFYPLLPPKIL
jgi:hypothetical protein